MADAFRAIAGWLERWKKLIGLGAAVGGVFGAGVLAGRWSLPFEGEVLSVRERPTAPGTFDASGTVTGLPRGAHLWLAVKADGRLWPKVPLPSISPRGFLGRVIDPGVKEPWAATLVEGRSDAFSVQLLAADGAGQRAILDWLRRGRAGGGFDGFADAVPGTRTVAILEVRPGPRVTLERLGEGLDPDAAPLAIPTELRVANATGYWPSLIVEDGGTTYVQPPPVRTDLERFRGTFFLGQEEAPPKEPHAYLVYAVLASAPLTGPTVCPNVAVVARSAPAVFTRR